MPNASFENLDHLITSDDYISDFEQKSYDMIRKSNSKILMR